MKNKAQDQNELFDVVDENDRVIAQATRGEVHACGLLHRAIHVLVFNTRGEVLLQQRSMQKDVAPGKWTTACSGHLDAGETYGQAAVRELNEELGVITNLEALELLFKYSPCEATGSEFIVVYKLVYDGTCEANPDEIDAIRWLTTDELNDWIKQDLDEIDRPFKLIWKEL